MGCSKTFPEFDPVVWRRNPWTNEGPKDLWGWRDCLWHRLNPYTEISSHLVGSYPLEDFKQFNLIVWDDPYESGHEDLWGWKDDVWWKLNIYPSYEVGGFAITPSHIRDFARFSSRNLFSSDQNIAQDIDFIIRHAQNPNRKKWESFSAAETGIDAKSLSLLIETGFIIGLSSGLYEVTAGLVYQYYTHYPRP